MTVKEPKDLAGLDQSEIDLKVGSPIMGLHSALQAISLGNLLLPRPVSLHVPAYSSRFRFVSMYKLSQYCGLT